MPLLVLLFVFIVVPLAELYVIIQVGQAIGILPTLAILLADSILGSMLLKSQGRAAWRRFNEATAEGRIPAREVVDGALIIFGGAFLISPGFITDIFGILLLLPPTRALFRRFIVGFFTRRSVIGFFGSRGADAYNRSRQRRPGPPPPDGDYVEGTATDYEDGGGEGGEPARRLDP
jgi:UPF0716 protein FxsA